MTWEEIKKMGSDHYKSEGVEPIDLLREGEILWEFAIGSIIKYAYRNREQEVMVEMEDKTIKDMEKIKHYADMLIFLAKAEMGPDAVDTGDWIFKH